MTQQKHKKLSDFYIKIKMIQGKYEVVNTMTHEIYDGEGYKRPMTAQEIGALEE